MSSSHATCPQNEPLALYILQKREELASKKDGYREKLDATLTKAYRNICESKNPICSLREASQVHGIGQWMLKLLKGFFSDASAEEPEGHDQQEASCTGKFNEKNTYFSFPLAQWLFPWTSLIMIPSPYGFPISFSFLVKNYRRTHVSRHHQTMYYHNLW